ncbi:cyclase family protein [Calothrix sp. NIES-4071]|nr:cyclase family protein [Calothrix sp. NIES-4071]BAZ59229.1 cyclase family protein [Calothrix sp. NIES-4105]
MIVFIDISVDKIQESPLQKVAKPLHSDEKLGVRIR